MALPSNQPTDPVAARLIGGVFGFAFAGIGLTVLGFLWGTPFGQWDSPPIFFRIFGSFIALVFVVFGGTMFVTMVKGRSMLQTPPSRLPLPPAGMAPGYRCPHCGAPLPEKSDVSPLGDVKCPFCNTWFNIHQRSA